MQINQTLFTYVSCTTEQTKNKFTSESNRHFKKNEISSSEFLKLWNQARPKTTFRRLIRIIRLRYSYWRHAMAKLSGFQNSLALGTTSSAPRLFLPPEKFPIAILGSTLSPPLEGTATAILGSNLECSLGLYQIALEAPWVLPWEGPRVRLISR